MKFRLVICWIILLSSTSVWGQWTVHRLGVQASLTQALAVGNGTILLSDSIHSWLSLDATLNWTGFSNAPAKTTALVQGQGTTIWAGNQTGPQFWYKSIDSGRTWVTAVNGPGSPGIKDISAVSGTPYLFAVGSNTTLSQLWLSRDRGLSFAPLGLPSWQGVMRRTCFLDTLTGFVGDHDGALFKTTDQGQSWQMVNMLATGMIQETTAIQFFNDSLGILVYRSGVNFHTTNRGNTWTMGNTRLDYPIDEVEIINDSVVLALASQGQFPLSISYDRGLTFQVDSTFNPTVNCNRIHLLQDGRVMILGDSGTYWMNGSLVASSLLKPLHIQVFPNPGTTIIQTSGLPEETPLVLSVYNLQGQLVKQYPSQTSRVWVVSDLAAGSYLLKYSGRYQEFRSIWIKQ